MNQMTSPRKQDLHDHAHGFGRSIVPTANTTTLTTTQLQERAIIYRSEVARPEVDAFRELRTRLLAAASGNFITLVASVSPGSGGSFVARNLAAAFAFDASKSALLVDCDLSHPSQHRSIQVDCAEGGLVDYLDQPDFDIDSVIYPTGVARLSLLPVGTPGEVGAEYFSSQRMQLLLEGLQAQHRERYIVLDAPPVKGAPDARILAGLADLVVLVAGYGCDTPRAIAEAAASFDAAKFAGVVFNDGV